MSVQSGEKRRTNVTLDAGLLKDARALGLNVSAISETALAEAVRAARGEAWLRENAEALDERRAWIARRGTALADLQVFKPERWRSLTPIAWPAAGWCSTSRPT